MPKPPKKTLAAERFIALHMMIDNKRPEAPSSAPAMMRTLLDITKPVAEPARPAYALRMDITTGISAAPIGMTI